MQKKSLVILHGWGHNGNLWKSLADKFGPNASALDLPGFGNEPLVKDDWGVPEYADWVIEKIKNKKEVILIGHSFGGRIAAEIASKNPKYLKALVLSGAPCIYRPTTLTKTKIKFYKFMKILVPHNIRKYFYSGGLKSAGKLEKIFRKAVSYDQTQKLINIKVPTLLVWGEKDLDVPVNIAEEMNKLISNSELKIIEDTGHNSYLENPNLFYAYVKKFIKNV